MYGLSRPFIFRGHHLRRWSCLEFAGLLAADLRTGGCTVGLGLRTVTGSKRAGLGLGGRQSEDGPTTVRSVRRGMKKKSIEEKREKKEKLFPEVTGCNVGPEAYTCKIPIYVRVQRPWPLESLDSCRYLFTLWRQPGGYVHLSINYYHSLRH